MFGTNYLYFLCNGTPAFPDFTHTPTPHQAEKQGGAVSGSFLN